MLLYISIPIKQIKKKNKQVRNSTLYAMPVNLFKYAYFCRAFWMPSYDVRQDILASGTPFLCIQSMFTRITFGSKWVSKWINVQYSNVLQILDIIRNTFILRFLTNKFVWKIEASCFAEACLSFEITTGFGSFSKLFSIDCSRRAMIHFRINTLQADSMYLTQEI